MSNALLAPNDARALAMDTGHSRQTGAPGLAGALAAFQSRVAGLPKLATVAALALLMTVLIGMVWLVSATSSQRQLFAMLSDADRAAVTSALDAAAIGYSIDPATGALLVEEQDYHQARMTLAADGLPRSSPTGSELLADLPMGSSRAMEGQRLRAARELDLARTIEAIDAVQHARVMLSESERSPFALRSGEPSASVMLELGSGRSLGEEQVDAIVHLVASSAQGLSSDRVSVVDQRGNLLSRRKTGNDARLATKIALEQRYREAIASVLTPMLGDDGFSAEVAVDLDFADTESSAESVPTGPVPIGREQGNTSVEVGAPGAGGIPGVLANQPAPAAEVTDVPPPGDPAQAAQQQIRNQNFARDFVVPRSVEITRRQGPTVTRLSIAVAVRAPARAAGRQARLADLERLVSAAVGADPRRGDVVVVAERPFAARNAPEMAWWEQPIVLQAGRWLGVLFVAALLFWFVVRPLVRWIIAAQRQQTPVAGQPDEAGAGGMLADLRDPANLPVAALRGFAQQSPERTAQLVRALIRQQEAATRG